MKKLLYLAVITICVLLTSAPNPSVHAQLDRFTGVWTNVDPNTLGIVKLEIKASGDSVTVRAWGNCHPDPCDWGIVDGFAYGPDVSSNLDSETEAITALFDPGFSQTIIVIHAIDDESLEAETFTRFTDQSGRTSFRATYTFSREGGMPTLISPPCGSTFSHFPRTTTLTWTAVPNAASYTVEIDCLDCCQVGAWCSDIGQALDIVPNLTTTSYTFSFVGAQPGRWRVWAVFPDGIEGQKTDWCEFSYTS